MSNTYNAYWKNEVEEVEANNSYEAQLKAASMFQSRTRRKVKSYEVTTQLVLRDGEPVIHSTGGL